MKRMIIPMVLMAFLLIPTVFAHDLNVTINVVTPPPSLTGYVISGGLTAQFFSALLVIGFLTLIIKLYLVDFKLNSEMINRTLIIVITGLILIGFIGVLMSI